LPSARTGRLPSVWVAMWLAVPDVEGSVKPSRPFVVVEAMSIVTLPAPVL